MRLKEKNAERILAPEGVHQARLIRMLDCGSQYSQLYKKSSRKVRVTFELVDTKHIFDEVIGEQPFLIDREYTLSIGKRSTFRKDLDSWRGTKLTKEEAEDFDPDKLLSTAGLVQVVHTPSADGEDTYANIQSLMALPSGTKVSEPENEVFSFWLEGEVDENRFDSFPEFIQEKITSSPEYKALTGSAQPQVDVGDVV
jgi:hypothetical protein